MRNVDSRPEFDPPVIGIPDRAADRVAAWEMIEAGRYQPRRFKGSNPGRELG